MLDVGCGAGSSLGLLSTRGLRCTGIDISVALASAAADSASVCVGDAEALPFTDGTFDGLLVECVLSALPDKRKTVAELGRLLPPGGVLLLSDVTVNGPLPEPLDSLAGWIACAAGALSITEYTGLLEDGGFRVLWAEDREDDLATLLAQVRRRLALFHGAVAAGLVDVTSIGFPAALMDVGEQMVTLAVEAVGDGTLGYAALLAGRT
jgi:SAM-dependent methyltransferase